MQDDLAKRDRPLQHSLKCLPIPAIDALGHINDLEAGPALIARLIAQLRSAETIQEREVAATVSGEMDKRVLPARLHDKQGEVRHSAGEV
ncbi:MAG TPA: hypothetical protein VFV38_10720 [Ktedonobacteraceae bacterium]|nr:hypothetical protein [Ktedonobacteraceae bacterium]